MWGCHFLSVGSDPVEGLERRQHWHQNSSISASWSHWDPTISKQQYRYRSSGFWSRQLVGRVLRCPGRVDLSILFAFMVGNDCWCTRERYPGVISQKGSNRGDCIPTTLCTFHETDFHRAFFDQYVAQCPKHDESSPLSMATLMLVQDFYTHRFQSPPEGACISQLCCRRVVSCSWINSWDPSRSILNSITSDLSDSTSRNSSNMGQGCRRLILYRWPNRKQ